MPDGGPIPAGSGLPRPQPSASPPMGVSPATGPTPNKGYEMAAMNAIGTVVNKLMEVLSMVGPTSDIGKTLMDVIQKLTKHVKPGDTSQAAQRNVIREMEQKNLQASQTNKQLQGGGGMPGMP